MGSRLEKNSTLVRKRIENHNFEDEEGEEYSASKFGGFSEYMRRKKIKLQNLDAQLRSQSDKPQIFKNIVAQVNGYTQPSLSDLHKLIVEHGGGFLQYLDGKTAVTHIICSSLTPKKKEEFKAYRIVKPAWVVDSVAAGKLLPWERYRVLDEGVKQKVIGFGQDGSVQASASQARQGYREQSDTSWYATYYKDAADQLDGRGGVGPEQLERAMREQDRIAKEVAGQVFNNLDKPVQEQGEVQADTAIDLGDIAESFEAAMLATIDQVAEETEEKAQAEKPTVSDQTMTKNGLVPENAFEPAEPMKRKLTAEEHNAILLQNPHMAKSSTANPDFLNQYYRESRLHHLSAWKADLKAQLQARAQESSSQKHKTKKPPGARRYVMHVDFDSFFVAVSMKKHPHLKDKVVVVAHGSGPGSEIASCNYPARERGIKNGMWMKVALELCKDINVLPYDYKAYEEASKLFYDSILGIEGVVQSISIDEALIDVTDQCLRASGSDGKSISPEVLDIEQKRAQELAGAIRDGVREKTSCEVSVGIGGNILLAKTALRKAKPAGQYLIKPEDVLDFLADLKVDNLPGFAHSVSSKLKEIRVETIREVRDLTKERLQNLLGPKTGEKLYSYARGIDEQEVGDVVIRKSVSAEVNWGIRFLNDEQAEEFVRSLAAELSRRLLENLVKGRQLSFKIMRKAADAGLDPPKNLGHGKCDTFNKSIILGVATNDKQILGKEAVAILRAYGFPPGELRGLGLQMQRLEPIKPVNHIDKPIESSQRRLQFKKPEITPRAHKVIDSNTSDIRKPSKTPVKSSSAMSPRSEPTRRDLIEDLPSPNKQETVPRQHDLSALSYTGTTPLHIGGTQFIMPSQVDQDVLAELPADIREKLAPRQSELYEARTRKGSNGSRSRSVSPFVSDSELLALPSASQIDPEILAALPESVRKEVEAEYRNAERRKNNARTQQLLPQSPRKGKPLLTKKLTTSPLKKHKFSSVIAKTRGKKTKKSSSGLMQANFVSVTNRDSPVPDTDTADEVVSTSFLAELPEDIQKEILAEQRRKRMAAKSGLSLAQSRKRPRPGRHMEETRTHRKLSLPAPPPKPTFTSRKLSTLPQLREAMSAWVQAFSDSVEDGPFPEDVESLGAYLQKVVIDERDMEKAEGTINWLTYIIVDWPFHDDAVRKSWHRTVNELKETVQVAVSERGLAPLQFSD